jgi:beta-glucosidase
MTDKASTPDYLNPALPIAERVQDLLNRMTLDEKISQMRNACSAIPRLGIPAYDYWSEALHGVARNGRATVFPQAIGMAATWDPDLIERVGDAISDEGRAKFHAALRKNGGNMIYQGLTFWSPNVNIFRDPRWGRGQETWGEDPYLTGEMGSAFVHGIQGRDPKYLKAAACAKHYAVHSGPEKLRHTFNAEISKRDLYATYLPAFKKLVQEAKVESVMGAYNRVLGESASASKLLLQDILRDEWGFEGHVVSDCGALTDIHANHKITKDGAETAALAVKMGCDIGCDSVYYDFMAEAIERGLVGEADLDKALGRTLATRFKLGLFDPEGSVPFTKIPMSVVGCEKHVKLARETADKSIVLLRNRNNLLPIAPKTKSILVVGPNSGNINVLLGNYYGLNTGMITLLEGIAGRAPEGTRVEFMPGSLLANPKRIANDWSIYSAPAADVVIACMGLSPLLEGEEGEAILSDNGDREDIRLPDVQLEYLKKLATSGAKVVLVLSGGSPVALDGLEDLVDAILYVWYPGQEGGNALADVLFGDVNPSGHLPLTFPKSLDYVPPFEDYSMEGRTHRYIEYEPLFPFGFGLSYTQFSYSDLVLDQRSIQNGESLKATLTVRNTGALDGEEVVQVYLNDLAASVDVPNHSLIDFRRVTLKAGESQTIEFSIMPEKMMLVDEDGKLKLEPGNFRLEIGNCSPGARGQVLGASAPVSAVFTVK